MIRQAIVHGAGSCAAWCMLFFGTLPFWGSTFVWCLKTALETLNHFGS